MDVSDLQARKKMAHIIHTVQNLVWCQMKMIIEQLKMFLMMTAMSLMFVNRHLGTKALNKYLRRKATKCATRFHAEHI